MPQSAEKCGVYAIAVAEAQARHAALLSRLRHFVPTWNLNALAQYFLSLLPPTDGAYHVARKRLIEDVRCLYHRLMAIPHLDVYPTGANFVLFKITNGATAADLQARLLTEHRMYVRDCSNKVGMDTFHVRVASQGRDKDAELVEALRTLTR